MLSDFQSGPIRAIGGRLKIGGHLTPPISEFADFCGEWPTIEGADLRREVPSEGLLLWLFVWARKSPGGGDSPIGGTTSPASPSADGADWNGNWRRELRETRPPCPLPPFSIVVRVGEPEFSKRGPPRPATIHFDRGFFEPPIVPYGGEGSPPPISTVPGTPPGAPSPAPHRLPS